MTRPSAVLLFALLGAPPLVAQQAMTPRDSALHVLNRLAYGPTPGLVDQLVHEGVLHWIDRQLAVGDIEDPGLKGELARYDLLQSSTSDLLRSFVEVRRQRQLVK